MRIDLASNRADSEMAAISSKEEHRKTLQDTILSNPQSEDASMARRSSRGMLESSISGAELSQLKPPTSEQGSSRSTSIPGMSLSSRQAWQRLEQELTEFLSLDTEEQDESNVSRIAAASEVELQTVAKSPLSEHPRSHLSTEGLKREHDVYDELDDKKPSARK